MSYFDVFNGDADGICALHQLRLAQPRESVLLSGVKRDIALLARVPAGAGDVVTVLDVSLDRNRASLLQLLARGVEVAYFDHHFAGAIPADARLRTFIDPAPQMCTSAIVDRYLQGSQRLWAIVGAFGDNLPDLARTLGGRCRLQPQVLEPLRQLGEAMNYNAYGDSESDLLVPPVKLYEAVRPYADPFDFLTHEPVAQALGENRRRDLELALVLAPLQVLAGGMLYGLPATAWARRVQGAYANVLATRSPALAHAVLRERGPDGFAVSVRAPLRNPQGADRLCLRFAGGGGRAGAAGIDDLPRERLAEFVAAFDLAFRAAPAA